MYYLHENTAKTGDRRYFFSTKSEGNLVDSLPAGYEIYEHPYSQVFLRTIQPQIIAENERAVVYRYIKALTPSRRYIFDIWGKDITVFESQEDIDVLKEVFHKGTPEGFSIEEAINLTISFAPALQFTLENKEDRLFIVKRFCFPGAVDEWRHIAGPDSLANLAKEYIRYLGTESFYELL